MSIDPLDHFSARDRQGIAQHQRYAQERAATDSAAGASAQSQAAENSGEGFFGEDGFGFDDFIDMINPLQHLPVISTIYREATGDEIAPGARIVGGALFGGPVGLAVAIANTAVEEASGKDIGEIALAAVGLDDTFGPGDAPDVPTDTMLAAAEPTTPAAASSSAPVSQQTAMSNVEPEGTLREEPLGSVAPAAGNATRRQSDVEIPELSQDQLALLLNSVGLDQTDLPAAVQRVAAVAPSASGPATTSLVAANHTDDPLWSARVMLETFGGYTALSDDTAPTRGKMVNSNL